MDQNKSSGVVLESVVDGNKINDNYLKQGCSIFVL
jgi:hypothetical protein